MSFYDDLGVSPDATAAAIRDRYRLLVRLFHPDQFSDPALKEAAEDQLRRLNRMQAVLADPEQRRKYDEALFLGKTADARIIIETPPPVKPKRRLPWRSLAWAAAGFACSGAIVWVSGHEAPPPVPVAMEIPAPAVAAPHTKMEDWRARARAAIAERDQALRELERLRAELAPPLRASISRFAGVWFYPHGDEPIETKITERDGQVRGRYRSASLSFEFAGQADDRDSAQLSLIRDDGTRGEVRLRLISERELELAWTSAGGDSPATLNGSTVLIKSQ